MTTHDQLLNDLLGRIPPDEYKRIMSQYMCELDKDFLGFINVYGPLSQIIPEDLIVIDFGCYLAAQSYFFTKHRGYIGVDLVEMERFTPKNAMHYVSTIQDFLKNEAPKMFKEKDESNYFAICSYVPDFKATALVRKTFSNVFSYYPTCVTKRLLQG